MIQFASPASVHTTNGAYSHTATVPAGTELVFVSGQVGLRPDGTLPESLEDQSKQLFANLQALLDLHGAKVTDIVKITAFLVAGQDLPTFRGVRKAFMNGHAPTSTLVFISQLVDPAMLVEVEAVVAKPVK
jgi:enamine deaminase RidA (YjgF/YER057c/UK114 family)